MNSSGVWHWHLSISSTKGKTYEIPCHLIFLETHKLIKFSSEMETYKFEVFLDKQDCCQKCYFIQIFGSGSRNILILFEIIIFCQQ